MRIQFCSDLHLGINERKEFPELLEPIAPVLALLGDIGDPDSEIFTDFLSWCCRHWSQVLFVPGNHEFWTLRPESQKTINSVQQSLKRFESQFKNFKFCWRQKLYSEDGVILLATPLWSRPAEGLIPHPQEQAYIDRDRSFDAETLLHLHEADLNWIQHQLKLCENEKVVLLTHYAPSLMLIDSRTVQDADATLYASDLDTLLRPPIVAWVSGHIHKTIQWFRDWETATGDSGQILLTTNPHGYRNENPYYRKDAVLRIDSTVYPDVDEYLSGMSCKTLQ